MLANGDTVSGTDITVKDSHGNELYNLTTDQYGMTPQIVLASDFHLISQVLELILMDWLQIRQRIPVMMI